MAKVVSMYTDGTALTILKSPTVTLNKGKV